LPAGFACPWPSPWHWPSAPGLLQVIAALATSAEAMLSASAAKVAATAPVILFFVDIFAPLSSAGVLTQVIRLSWHRG
jgi:hypothetical protein